MTYDWMKRITISFLQIGSPTPFLRRFPQIYSSADSVVGFFIQLTGMIREIELILHVRFPIVKLENNKDVPTSVIVNKFLKKLSNIKACRYGYFLAVTKLISIGPAADKCCPRDVCFPVKYHCRIFIPLDDEIMNGIVHRVFSLGVFLMSGPMDIVYLSSSLMPNYNYVSGKKPFYVREDMSKIEIGVVIRFVVFAVRFIEDRRMQFKVLASIDGDGLGPVSVAGLDGLDL